MTRKKCRVQYAALPYRFHDGELEVMLITSRQTRRWIIPKGWPEKKLSPSALAAREAFEEAGLVGRADDQPLGSYSYQKLLRPRRSVTCKVEVFPLEVDRELDDWPERGQREKRWVTPGEAALLVEEAGLVEILLNVAVSDDRLLPA